VYVQYTLTNDDELLIDYYATTDQATPLNLTNHLYWNLSGQLKRSVEDNYLKLPYSYYLPKDSEGIPTGEIKNVSKDPKFNFTQFRNLKRKLHAIVADKSVTGLDHCYVKSGSEQSRFLTQSETTPLALGENGSKPSNFTLPELPTDMPLHDMAVLIDGESGRKLTVKGTQPGLQVYTADNLNEFYPYVARNAICLETQHYPDSVHQPTFPSVILEPGKIYRHRTVYAFSIAGEAEVRAVTGEAEEK